MQTKVLMPMQHWIDYELYTTQILDEAAQSQKIEIITGNLHKYLAPLISAEDQYSLVLNLYACADNPHLYHLIGDIHVFPREKLVNILGNKEFLPERQLAKGGIGVPINYAAIATQHNPPPGPPPPPIIANTNFLTHGDQYISVNKKFSISIGFGQAIAPLNVADIKNK
jgi:hypothetical protein